MDLQEYSVGMYSRKDEKKIEESFLSYQITEEKDNLMLNTKTVTFRSGNQSEINDNVNKMFLQYSPANKSDTFKDTSNGSKVSESEAEVVRNKNISLEMVNN